MLVVLTDVHCRKRLIFQGNRLCMIQWLCVHSLATTSENTCSTGWTWKNQAERWDTSDIFRLTYPRRPNKAGFDAHPSVRSQIFKFERNLVNR